MNNSEKFQIPDLCPSCAGPTTVQGDFLFCLNKNCPSKLSGDVYVWIRNLGLLNWGDALISKLTDPDNLRVSSVADLYRLRIEDIASCCSGLKMAQKCYQVLHQNKSVSLELVLSSLNIPNFGISTASDIVRAGFNTVEKVLRMSYEDLCSVPNIGEKTAQQILDGFLSRREILLDLSTLLSITIPVSGGSLKGKTFCITGELSEPRKKVEKLILDSGGFPKSSVSKDTSYLVTNSPESDSSKMKNARKYGIPIISESDLYKLISDTS